MPYKELIDKKIGEVYQAGIATKILQQITIAFLLTRMCPQLHG